MQDQDNYGWDYIFTYRPPIYLRVLRYKIIKEWSKKYNYPIPFLKGGKRDYVAFLPYSITNEKELIYGAYDVSADNNISADHYYYFPQFKLKTKSRLELFGVDNALNCKIRTTKEGALEEISLLRITTKNLDGLHFGGLQIQDSGQLCLFYSRKQSTEWPAFPSPSITFKDNTVRISRELIFDKINKLLSSYQGTLSHGEGFHAGEFIFKHMNEQYLRGCIRMTIKSYAFSDYTSSPLRIRTYVDYKNPDTKEILQKINKEKIILHNFRSFLLNHSPMKRLDKVYEFSFDEASLKWL